MSAPKIILVAGMPMCSEHGKLAETRGRWTGRLMYECPECSAYVLAADIWKDADQ